MKSMNLQEELYTDAAARSSNSEYLTHCFRIEQPSQPQVSSLDCQKCTIMIIMIHYVYTFHQVVPTATSPKPKLIAGWIHQSPPETCPIRAGALNSRLRSGFSGILGWKLGLKEQEVNQRFWKVMLEKNLYGIRHRHTHCRFAASFSSLGLGQDRFAHLAESFEPFCTSPWKHSRLFVRQGAKSPKGTSPGKRHAQSSPRFLATGQRPLPTKNTRISVKP